MQPRSLLTRELARTAGHGEAQRASQSSSQAKLRCKLDVRLQPVAAELQAILRGHLGGTCGDSGGLSVFGTSPPPRDCQNALVRDAGFNTMREGPPVISQQSSCASACHYTAIRDSSFYSFCDRSCNASPYFSSPVSVLSSAAA